MLNLQEWLDMHESPKEIGGIVCYVRSHDVVVLVDQIRRELSEPVASLDVEEFIYTHGNSALMRGAIIDVVPIDALTAWMAGHVRVPVEPTPDMIRAGQIASRHWAGSDSRENGLYPIYRAMLTASKGQHDE